MTEDDLPTDDLSALLTLEHEGWRALRDGTAVAFYDRTMAADAVMVIATGEVLERATVLDAFRQAPPWHRYEIADPRLVTLDERAAVLVYRGSGWRQPGDPPFVATMTSTYRRHDTGWQLVLYQQTPLP